MARGDDLTAGVGGELLASAASQAPVTDSAAGNGTIEAPESAATAPPVVETTPIARTSSPATLSASKKESAATANSSSSSSSSSSAAAAAVTAAAAPSNPFLTASPSPSSPSSSTSASASPSPSPSHSPIPSPSARAAAWMPRSASAAPIVHSTPPLPRPPPPHPLQREAFAEHLVEDPESPPPPPPLYPFGAAQAPGVLTFVCETPRGFAGRQEVKGWDAQGNVQLGRYMYFPKETPWHYGYLPQTWCAHDRGAAPHRRSGGGVGGGSYGGSFGGSGDIGLSAGVLWGGADRMAEGEGYGGAGGSGGGGEVERVAMMRRGYSVDDYNSSFPPSLPISPRVAFESTNSYTSSFPSLTPYLPSFCHIPTDLPRSQEQAMGVDGATNAAAAAAATAAAAAAAGAAGGGSGSGAGRDMATSGEGRRGGGTGGAGGAVGAGAGAGTGTEALAAAGEKSSLSSPAATSSITPRSSHPDGERDESDRRKA
ncbi:unnamed protein product [Closterium sp. NIES-64]|nr:unnamed protein product [Closterium sp. NIES-64]